MNARVTGTFEVTMKPEPPYDDGPGATLGRISIDKVFHGPLDATATVEMLSAMSEVKGSAGYVALERVTGHLEGRAGSFILQHSGTMDRGKATLSCTVVPDSASGELAGLSGQVTIDIVDGQHRYTFDYAIAAG